MMYQIIKTDRKGKVSASAVLIVREHATLAFAPRGEISTRAQLYTIVKFPFTLTCAYYNNIDLNVRFVRVMLLVVFFL